MGFIKRLLVVLLGLLLVVVVVAGYLQSRAIRVPGAPAWANDRPAADIVSS